VDDVASATNDPTTRDNAIEREIGELAEELDPVPQGVVDAAKNAFSSRARGEQRRPRAEDEPARSR